MLVYPFPETVDMLIPVTESRNISYLVLDNKEPTYPAYIWADRMPKEEIFGKYPVRMFEEYGEIRVWVYNI